MPRRRWPWVIALALVALMAAIIFWPRQDDYAFLRGLHPKESYGVLSGAHSGLPDVAYHRFEFSQSYEDVWGALFPAHKELPITDHASTGPTGMVDTSPERVDTIQFPNGHHADLTSYGNQPVILTIWDEKPSWIQGRIEAIRGFFHL